MTRTAQERDLGIIWTPDLKFREEIEETVKKANNIVGIVRRSFTYMTATSFKLLFKALVRPHLEYGAPVWNPATLREINRIEGVQRRATKMLPGMKERSYEERLKAMDLPTLRFRRLRGDLIEAFKICTGLYKYPPEELLPKNHQNNRTRGHELKLEKRAAITTSRLNTFTMRVMTPWNQLPASVIQAPSVNSFKNRLDANYKQHPLKFNHNA